ncbi:tetratricopeptide repeat protein [Streptomyces sp. p1417]|uniref:Tetratricopeptide repeat protein n=1 Tax=Streptomyces typhae TaxID=2681492 RepID=A0A6L6WW85_9ACTN|nr:tetratricopeptide repeat protein [Streptomyces typhae]MVO86137.1 tetratricopeptide repeat protein [Streptomyces typhae]
MGENHVSGGRQGNLVQADSIGQLTITTANAGGADDGARGPLPRPRPFSDPERWHRMSDWDALAAGAHRARPGEGGTKLPPYVSRDVDAELRDRVREAADLGGFVLVVGDSTAGKTRAAYEAVRDVLPEYRVLAPPAGARLRCAPEAVEACGYGPCVVVWLDDLERHLGPDGLTPDVLDDFARLRVPVVATMRLKPYEAFGSGDDAGTGGDSGEQRWAGVGSRVLRAADVVDLDRLWSAGELSRAGDCDDSRITEALTHHGTYGIAEYMAAGPVLLRTWRHAWRAGGHPRGAALVAAAVDLTRAGLRGPYSRELLVEVHQRRLADAGGPVLRPEGVDEAFAWASRVRHGVTSLLVPVAGELWAPFDYLVDAEDSPVPEWVREAALAHAGDDDVRFAVATSAYEAGAFGVAEKAMRPLADAGNRNALFNLAVVMGRTGRTGEAEALYGQAHSRGSLNATVNLGILLAEAGRTEEAEALLRSAHAQGVGHAADNLAVLLRRTGRAEEAATLQAQPPAGTPPG